MVAAQSTDLQRVWRLVQELSAQLKSNQRETERLRRYVELNPPSANGTGEIRHGRDSSDSEDSEKLKALRHAYSQVVDENETLKTENDSLAQLCAEFEVGLTRTMEQIRNHEYEVTTSTLALHKNYASKIMAQTEENEKLKKEAVEMQGQLHTVSQLVRSALEAQSDVAVETIIEALRLENQECRKRLEMQDTFVS